jgi:hypothetical protein
MTDDLTETSLFKRFKATPSVPDPMADKVQVQIAFDEVLSQLGVSCSCRFRTGGFGNCPSRGAHS